MKLFIFTYNNNRKEYQYFSSLMSKYYYFKKKKLMDWLEKVAGSSKNTTISNEMEGRDFQLCFFFSIY